MSEFKRLSDTMLASEQIEPVDIARAREAGVTLIVNNRPDGESYDQPEGEAIRMAAQEAGIAYRAIPIGQGGFGMDEISAMGSALYEAPGKVLAFCRSGTRSTLLWALARAHAGDDLAAIEAAAQEAGYSLAPVRGTMEQLARER